MRSRDIRQKRPFLICLASIPYQSIPHGVAQFRDEVPHRLDVAVFMFHLAAPSRGAYIETLASSLTLVFEANT